MMIPQNTACHFTSPHIKKQLKKKKNPKMYNYVVFSPSGFLKPLNLSFADLFLYVHSLFKDR